MDNISIGSVKKVESIVDGDCGYTDTKHKLNLTNKIVPQSVLDQVEKGCPLETLEALTGAEFPICKYKTQITIHGLFPALNSSYIGGYKKLVRNANGSVGVKWTAIDYEKKAAVFKIAHKIAGWNIHESSTDFFAYKSRHLTQENCAEVIAEFKSLAANIDKSLFYGNVSVYVAESMYFGKFAVCRVDINAFYEKNRDTILCNLTGCADIAAVNAKLADIAAKEQADRDALEKRLAESEAKRKAAKDALAKRNADWVAANPAPFPIRENYTLKVGDIFARPVASVRYGDKAGEYDGYKCYIVSKAFGKMTATPCDANGVKERFVKGKEIASVTGSFYVKSVAVAPVPVYTPHKASPAPAPVAGVTVTENTGKGGIEIRFPSKPSAAVLASLKSQGWRWSKFGGCWYIKASDTARAFAKSLAA